MAKSALDIIDFASSTAETISYSPDADKIVGGNPTQTVKNIYDDETGVFSTGIWTGEIGIHKVNYTEEEFCMLLTGKVKISSDDGSEKIFNTGDSFVIPSGFSGLWETIESASKIYVVYEKG